METTRCCSVDDALDRALTETFDANLASANLALTDAQYRQALSIRAASATVAGRTVTCRSADA